MGSYVSGNRYLSGSEVRGTGTVHAFTYNPTLYENEWPLYRVGVLENVLDFAYTQDKVAEINMKREIQSVQIPDEYFKMQYMDMKTGLDHENNTGKIYEDDTKYFQHFHDEQCVYV